MTQKLIKISFTQMFGHAMDILLSLLKTYTVMFLIFIKVHVINFLTWASWLKFSCVE